MANEQAQTSSAPAHEVECAQDHLLFDPQGWMKVSTFTVLDLSEDEMEHVAGGLLPLKITID